MDVPTQKKGIKSDRRAIFKAFSIKNMTRCNSKMTKRQNASHSFLFFEKAFSKLFGLFFCKYSCHIGSFE